MKTAVILLILVLSGKLIACDDQLKSFASDCALQDRYTSVREIFRAHNLVITETSEYKALRFIDRYSWENNLKNKKLSIEDIYDPAPETWNVWNEGINSLFSSDDSKNYLNGSNILSDNEFSHINSTILTANISNSKLPPGKIREDSKEMIGFCTPEDVDIINARIKKSNESMKAFEETWEKKANISLKKALKKMDADKANKATLQISMMAMPNGCMKGKGSYVYYTFPANVKMSLEWLRAFVKYNLELYKNNAAAVSPIELSAVVQKWLVSIHPFTDGNGRTSRVVQDLILAHFDLPFAPAGDLQDDALLEISSYVKMNYQAMEHMVSFLETCAVKIKANEELPYQCKAVSEVSR